MWKWFHKLASPPYAFALAGRLQPWFLGAGIALLLIGAFGGLVIAPADYQQHDAFRVIYIHVPAAYLSMMAYSVMAIAAGVGMIWRIKLAHAVAVSCAPVGAWFTVLALVTGAIWGRPMWGTWWAWDPRVTSELLLLFVYLGYMALRSSFDDIGRADRASAVLALVGAVDVPIIHFSVIWWNSLHQGPTLIRSDGPAMPGSMLWPLLTMLLAYTVFFVAVLCDRLRAEILRRERGASWLSNALAGAT